MRCHTQPTLTAIGQFAGAPLPKPRERQPLEQQVAPSCERRIEPTLTYVDAEHQLLTVYLMGILQIPGAHCGLAALQAKAARFEALDLSGAAMSASMGLPDLGILTIDDCCFFVPQISRASQLPVLVDGDTGFGEVLNVMNMVRAFEDAGAAVQIEDKILPKKCGHLNDKKLIAPADMAAKIAAAAKARRHLYIVARTDAVADEGLESAISRARLYVEAGADAIFPEALNEPEAFDKFAKAIKVPLLANMTECGRPRS